MQAGTPHPLERRATSFSRALMRIMHIEKMSLPMPATAPHSVKKPVSAHAIGMRNDASAAVLGRVSNIGLVG